MEQNVLGISNHFWELFSYFLWFFQVLRKLGYACLAVLAAGVCFVVSGTGLALGPLCLHNSTDGLKWGRPLKQVKTGCVRTHIVLFLHYFFF